MNTREALKSVGWTEELIEAVLGERSNVRQYRTPKTRHAAWDEYVDSTDLFLDIKEPILRRGTHF